MVDLELLLNAEGVYYGVDDRAHVDVVDLKKMMCKRSFLTLAAVTLPV